MAPVLSKEFLDIQAIGLIMKTWDDRFASKVGGWGILRNGKILIMWG